MAETQAPTVDIDILKEPTYSLGIEEEYLLVDRETAIGWAKAMTWKGLSPMVNVLNRVFETGATISKKAIEIFQDRLDRNPHLPKWDVVIKPASENRRIPGHRETRITLVFFLMP